MTTPRSGRRVAAVTCCEADDRVAHSAALRAATPRPLDATLACHRRRPTSTRSRPTAVSTGAPHCHNGASVRRTLTEYSRATPHALGVHHTRLRGRSQRMLRVHVEFDRSCASSAGPTTAGVQLIRCVNRAFRNSGASPDVSRRCVRAANVRARAYAHGHACVRARA